MRNVFGRRSSSALPDDVTETWDATAGVLVLHLPVDTSQPESHDGADLLSDRIVAVVDAINDGSVGADTIPEDATAPTARIRLEPTHRSLGRLETSTVEAFQERLGRAIPLETAAGTTPVTDEAADAEDTPDEPVDDGQVVELPEIAFAWDDAAGALAAQVDVPRTTSDGASRRALKAATDALFASLRDPSLAGLVPEGRTPAYVLTVSFPTGAVVGDATLALVEQIDGQLAGTALTVDVVAH